MKNQKMGMLISALILTMSCLQAQTINWGSLDSNRHIINANAGFDYGAVFGVGYGYQIKNNLFPMIANIEYSFPSGENLFDDFKTKIGVQISWFEFHHFQFSTKLHGVFRRYETDYARLVNFGSDLSGVVGYYRSKWFVAGEVGFDKAIITHFKHTGLYSDQFPDVSNGWFGPTTGGNFYYGLQAGYSFGRNDLYIRAGKVLTQDFKTSPLIPAYAQLGYNIKF